MQFSLSSRSPLNTVLRDPEGKSIYKVHTPLKISGRTTTISCVLPDDIPRSGDQSDTDDIIEGRFAHLAQFEWRTAGASLLRFGGTEVDVTSFFRKDGFGVYGHHRVFTAPDGHDYKWKLGVTKTQLISNDGLNTPIAQYLKRRVGLFGKPRIASLEIFPAGEDIVDAIIVTFIYVEHIRKTRE